MKALRTAISFGVALTLLVTGAYVRRPYTCYDCFEPHGFPFAYRQDGGYGGGAAFHLGGMIGDLLVLLLLTTLIAWAWGRFATRRRRTANSRDLPPNPVG